MKRTHIIATAATVFSILAVAALLAGCGSPDQDYEDAFRLDDVPRFRQVLKDHPDHPRAEEAHARLGVLLWQAVQQKPDTATLKLLIHQYSHADFAAGAIALLDSLNWGTARHANTVQSYRSYCDSFPDGAYSDKAQSLIEELVWDSVEVENSIQAYGNYCAEFPHGIYIENAKKLIEELSWQEAVDAGSMEMLEAFIAKYPDSQLRNAAERRIRALRKQKFTEVFEADDVERLRQLDDGNLEETTRNLFWWPPILLAADARSERLITYLIENGADVNARGADQATALHLAVRAGDLSVVGLLLQNNADIEANIEPEMSSVYVGDGTMTYHEAPPTAKKGTPLIWAAYYNQPQIISYLIKQGANVNADDGYGCTPVHFAAKSGSMDMLNELVAARADWRAASENNRRSTPDASPLHYASSVEIAQYFLNEGISLNMVSDLGMPIHAASRYGYIDVVRLYLSRGADVNAVCSWEISSFGFVKATPLWVASAAGNIDVIDLLVREGGNINYRAQTGGTLLHAAACGGRSGTIKHLIKQGLEVDERAAFPDARPFFADWKNITPLGVAIHYGHLGAIEALIEAGADVNTEFADEWNPLSVAIVAREKQIVAYLLENGANRGAKNYIKNWDTTDEINGMLKRHFKE